MKLCQEQSIIVIRMLGPVLIRAYYYHCLVTVRTKKELEHEMIHKTFLPFLGQLGACNAFLSYTCFTSFDHLSRF